MRHALTKYKDADPLDVIERARRILAGQLGMLPTETWLNPLEGFFSVNLRCENLPLFSNGKGVTRRLALASAYGEFMERLQNLVLYDTMRFDPDALKHQGFFHSPDEKLMTLTEALDDPQINALLPGEVQRGDRERIFAALAEMTPESCPRDFVAVPFFNIRTGEPRYIPLPFLRIFYGSNGMCAGSTPAEALVQGLCEVLERYVNREIIQQRIAAPAVPESYLSRYPQQYEMIQRIRQTRDCRVTIKDCSLNRGYPVVGMTYIDAVAHAYFVKFGAHPAFEIALERTLTEFLQGRDINNLTDLTEFCHFRSSADPSKNLMDIFVHGSGRYPVEFFGTNADYVFTPFPEQGLQDNRSFLEHLLKVVSDGGREALVRDVSFLGFPAFHVLVPGLSEITAFDQAEMEKFRDLAAARTVVNSRLELAGPDDLRGVVAALKSNHFVNADSIAQLLNAPVSEAFPWRDIKTDLFCSMVHFHLNEPGKAYESMKRFVAEVEGEPPAMGYYKCARDYLGMLSDGFASQRTESILEGVYGRELTCEVMSDLRDPADAFKYLEKLECWNCPDCAHARLCSYPELRRIHLAVKDHYLLHHRQQGDNRGLWPNAM